MRRDEAVGKPPQRAVGGQRLDWRRIQPGVGRALPVILQGRHERVMVHQPAAGDDDEARVRLHDGELRGREHPACLRRVRRRDHDHVRCRQEVVEPVQRPDLRQRIVRRDRLAVHGDNLHLETARSRANRPPDPTVADNAHCAAGQLPGHRPDARSLPAARGLRLAGKEQAATKGQEQREGVLGDIGRVGTTGVGDDDVALTQLRAGP